MIKYVLIVLALAGGCHYVSRHFKFDDSLEFVKRHKDASWAPRANYTIALIYHHRENYPKSQAAFTQLLTDYPTWQFMPKSLVYLYEAAEYNQDWETAKSALSRYIEEYPDGPDIALVRKRLELLKYHHGP